MYKVAIPIINQQISLQVMAQKLADTLRKELRWTLEQQNYVLHGIAPPEQKNAQAKFGEELQQKGLVLYAL